MLGSTGPWSFCCCLGGAAGSQPQCGATALLLLLPLRFLFHFPSSCYVVIITHAHAARRGIIQRAVTTSIETVAVIATGGRPIAESSDLRRRGGGAARCSAVARDGGGCGMAAAAGRGCRAAVRVVVALEYYIFYSLRPPLLLGRRQRELSPTAAAFFSFAAPRPSRGRKHAPSPSHRAAIPRRGRKREARARFFFVTAALALAIELSTPGFANSRIRAPPHVHPRSPGSRPILWRGLNEEFYLKSFKKEKREGVSVPGRSKKSFCTYSRQARPTLRESQRTPCRSSSRSHSRGESTKTPSPRMDPAERPTDPGRRN